MTEFLKKMYGSACGHAICWKHKFRLSWTCLMAVRSSCGYCGAFTVRVSLHQGSVFSLFLFMIVMDNLDAEVSIKHVDILLCHDDRTMEGRISRKWLTNHPIKDECMLYFIKRNNKKPLKLDGIELKSMQQFLNLGLVLTHNGNVDANVRSHMKSSW